MTEIEEGYPYSRYLRVECLICGWEEKIEVGPLGHMREETQKLAELHDISGHKLRYEEAGNKWCRLGEPPWSL